MFTENDVQGYMPFIFSRLSETINAKKQIQQLMLMSITDEERSALANDVLLNSLIEKVKLSAFMYSTTFGKNNVALACIAMATGTILKELDNGNLSYVSPVYLAELMNYFNEV